MSGSYKATSLLLHFQPQTLDWFVEVDGLLWRVQDRLEQLILVGYAVLSVSDAKGTQLADQCVGKVSVTEDPGEAKCKITFLDWHGNPARDFLEVHSISVELAFVRPLSGFHADEWMEVLGSVELDGFEKLGLRLFLPDVLGDEPKHLTIMHDHETLAEYTLPRGKLFEAWCDLSRFKRKSIELQFECDTAEPIVNFEEKRILGCIFVEICMPSGQWTKMVGHL